MKSIIKFKNISDNRGDLAFLESSRDIPFKIAGVSYIDSSREVTDITRQYCVICLAGNVQVSTFEGDERETMILNNPANGLCLGGVGFEIELSKQSVAIMISGEVESNDAERAN